MLIVGRAHPPMSSAAFNFPKPVPVLGRTEVADSCGMQIAMQTIHVSRRRGKYAHHLQVNTTRKMRTWVNNAYRAGEGAFNHGATLESNH